LHEFFQSQSLGTFGQNLVQHFAYVKKLDSEKYAKPKYLCQPPPTNANFFNLNTSVGDTEDAEVAFT